MIKGCLSDGERQPFSNCCSACRTANHVGWVCMVFHYAVRCLLIYSAAYADMLCNVCWHAVRCMPIFCAWFFSMLYGVCRFDMQCFPTCCAEFAGMRYVLYGKNQREVFFVFLIFQYVCPKMKRSVSRTNPSDSYSCCALVFTGSTARVTMSPFSCPAFVASVRSMRPMAGRRCSGMTASEWI